MESTKAIKAVFVDGQLTVNTIDVTNENSPVPLTTFVTTAMVGSYNPFGPGLKISCFKDKDLSTERKLNFSFPTDKPPSITTYMEYLTTESQNRPYDYEISDSTASIEIIEIAPNKHRYNFNEFKFLAKNKDSNETREVTGSGYFLITDLILPG